MRRFNGASTDKVDFGNSVHSEYTDGVTVADTEASTQSHGKPFRLSNGNIIVAYSTNHNGGNHEIYTKTSTDELLTFGSASVLEDDAGTIDAYEVAFVQLEDVNNTLIAFIGDGTNLTQRNSTNLGSTWGSSTTRASALGHDAHPSAVRIRGGAYDGDIVVVYADNGDIKCIRSTDGGVTIGSPITIATTGTLRDPSIEQLPSGDLLCVWGNGDTNATEIQFSKSSAGGTAWGTPATLWSFATSSYYPDPNILVCDGYTLISYADGANGSHAAYAIVCDPEVTQVQYRVTIDGTTSNDPHRVNGILNSNRKPVFCRTTYDADDDYEVKTITQKARSQPIADINDLITFTAWGWMRYHGTPNANSGMYIMSKHGISKVMLYIQDDGGAVSNQLRCYVDRTGTDAAFNSVNDVIADNTLTFVAAVFSLSLSPIMRLYAGTTPENLAEVGYSQQQAGSGGIVSDAAGNLVIGTRTTDDNRVHDGEIGEMHYTPQVITDLNVFRQLMVVEDPRQIGIYPAFKSPIEGHKTPVDYMTGRTGTVTGTTDPGFDPPIVFHFLPHEEMMPVVDTIQPGGDIKFIINRRLAPYRGRK